MFEVSRYPLSSQDRLIRWVSLSLFCTPIVGAYFYTQGYKLSFLVCPWKYWTGIPCPTCGMTRSFMAIVRGDWSHALAEHLFGPILFAGFLIASIHFALELLIKRKLVAFYGQLLSTSRRQLLAIIIILVYHAFRLHYLSLTGALYGDFIHSPLGQLLLSIKGVF